jgi:NAD(P)-dependent dehydrogenase (short-subunit alcohol dehydrogenase family)
MQITIIGAGPGISRAVAETFGSKGFAVGLIARNEEKLKAEAEALKQQNIQAAYAAADASHEASLNQALDTIAATLGTADIVLYNAYAPIFKPLEAETWESLQQEFSVNVGGAFFVLKKFLPIYKQQGKGKLFFTGGGLALQPQPNLTGLSMGKAALRSLVLGTAQRFRNSDIHLATITIKGFVKEQDPQYNPKAIAAEFWRLYEQRQDEFETEVVY